MGSEADLAATVYGSADAITIGFTTILGFIGHVLARALTTIISLFA